MNDELILVTGGTGHLGRDIIGEFVRHHRRLRVLARTPGADRRVEWAQGDLSTGEGLREALAGVSTVVNAATFSPIARRGSILPVDFFTTPSAVDVTGTQLLLQEAVRAKVSHFVHVSIVGLAPDNPLPYNRVKLAGEELVRGPDLPWSVVRATPYFYLLAGLLRSIRWMPLWPLPTAAVQPVDTRDVARYLLNCVTDGGRGIREDIGGPEVKPFSEFGREYLQARNLGRRILRLRMSSSRAKRMGLVTAHGHRGVVTWREWLATHEDEPGGGVRMRPVKPRDFSA